MNIKWRINARKILLMYFYEQYFLENAGKKTLLLEDVEKVEKIVQGKSEKEIILQDTMNANYYVDVDAEVWYIVSNHFKKFQWDEIDWSYIQALWPVFRAYDAQVCEQVNEHAVSFSYDDMDLIDRVLFVLGYMEFLLIKTPKKVVLNEMVELAKRYGDEKSPKLLNGIGHKILTEVEENEGWGVRNESKNWNSKR